MNLIQIPEEIVDEVGQGFSSVHNDSQRPRGKAATRQWYIKSR
jgi:predicted nuclease of restriction endonuclease-like (RecB) superfamily